MNAKELTKLFSPFTSDGKKIIPAVANDWTFETEYGYHTSFLSIESNSLSQRIVKADISSFLNMIASKKITIIGNKIQGDWCLTSNIQFQTSELFELYQSLLEEISATEIPKKDLIAGIEYKLISGKVLYLGHRYVQSFIINSSGIKFSKIKKAHMIYDYSNNSLREVVTKDKFLEEVSDRKGIAFVNTIISNHIKDSKYIFIRENEPTSTDLKYIFINRNKSKKYSYYGIRGFDDKVIITLSYDTFILLDDKIYDNLSEITSVPPSLNRYNHQYREKISNALSKTISIRDFL